MYTKIIAIILALALTIAGFLWISVESWQHHEMQRSLSEWAGVAEDESLFNWDMSGLDQIVLNGARDIDGLSIVDGALSGEVAKPFGFVSLNMAGRIVNTRRYHRLRTRIQASRETQLFLFHQEAGNNSWDIGSEGIALHAGWQELDLDLDELGWSLYQYGPDGKRLSSTPSRWGGATRSAKMLRLHPGRFPGTGFRIDWIRIDRVPLPDARYNDIAAEGGSYTPHAADLLKTSQDWLLTMPAGLRTPEWQLWFRDHVRTRTPDAILFPRAPEISDLAGTPEPARLSPSAADPEARLRNRLMTAAFVFLCAIWLVIGRGQPPRARAAGDLLIAAIGGAVLLALIPDLTAPPPWALVWTIALVGFALLSVRREKDFGEFGNRRAWLWAMGLTGVVAIALIVAGGYTGATVAAWPGEAVAYLPWALIQQLLLGPFLASRWERIVRRPEAAALLTGLMFGAIHFPNFALMSGTLVLGTLWALLFLRFRAWLPLAVSHAVLAPLPLLVLPVWLFRSAEVGARFWL